MPFFVLGVIANIVNGSIVDDPQWYLLDNALKAVSTQASLPLESGD